MPFTRKLIVAALAVAGMAAGPYAAATAAAPAAAPAAVPAAAAAGAANAVAAPTTKAAPHAVTTLVTGERLVARTAAGRTTYAAQRTAGSRVVQTYTLGDRSYAVPVTAAPYLGRMLDASLFDVTTLSATPDPARVAIRVSHTGARPAIPGVTLTADSSGIATGYVTAKSAKAFGDALAAKYAADHGQGSSTAFSRVTSIAAVAAAPAVVQPHFPMHTLIIKGIGADGAPMPFAGGLLMNVDQGAKYVGFISLFDGEARVSVPSGHYSISLTTWDTQGSNPAGRQLTVDQYVVSGDNQTLTLDARRATSPLVITLPRPVGSGTLSTTWGRTDATGSASISVGVFADFGSPFFTQPTKPSTIGRQSFSVGLSASSTTFDDPAPPAYTYDLYYAANHVDANQTHHVTPAQLATVTGVYDSDRRTTGAAFRYALDPNGGFITFSGAPLPQKRTEYVLATSPLPWQEESWGDLSADDWGILDGGPYTFGPGTSVTHTWRRGPLGAGVPTVLPGGFGTCWACRTPDQMVLGMAPVTDSTPEHSGPMFAAPDGSPVTHLQVTRDGTTVFDQPDYFAGQFDVTAPSSRYTMSYDVDRYWTRAVNSGRSHTEVTFTSKGGEGPLAPASWYCPGCRVLPVLQARRPTRCPSWVSSRPVTCRSR